jgi:hypothetical protein
LNILSGDQRSPRRLLASGGALAAGGRSPVGRKPHRSSMTGERWSGVNPIRSPQLARRAAGEPAPSEEEARAGRHVPERQIHTPDPEFRVEWTTRPRVDALTAALRYPLLVILPVILLVPAAYVLATHRKATYTAEAQVLMQQPAPTEAAALPGVVQAELSLSPVYARELQFDPVIVPLARRFHSTPAAIASRLSATPVPDSPIIRIDASSPSGASAVALANAAAQKLSTFISTQAQSDASAQVLLGRYRQATVIYQRDLARQRQLSRSHSSTDPQVISAATATQVAQQREQTLAGEYQAAAGSAQTTPTLGVFALASGASSNRTSNIEIYLFAAVVAGLVIGFALATLLANRRLRPSSRT